MEASCFFQKRWKLVKGSSAKFRLLNVNDDFIFSDYYEDGGHLSILWSPSGCWRRYQVRLLQTLWSHVVEGLSRELRRNVSDKGNQKLSKTILFHPSDFALSRAVLPTRRKALFIAPRPNLSSMNIAPSFGYWAPLHGGHSRKYEPGPSHVRQDLYLGARIPRICLRECPEYYPSFEQTICLYTGQNQNCPNNFLFFWKWSESKCWLGLPQLCQ